MRSWGCRRGASQDAIKSAFRKLAKKLHPDANKNDPKAAGRFAELNAAYEILGDEEKRKAFDRGEIDAEGKPRFQGFDRAAGAGAAGRLRAGRRLRELQLGTGRLPARRARERAAAASAAASTTFSRTCSVARAAADGVRNSSRRNSAAAARDHGADVTGTVTITLPEAASGTSRRVQLPTGKEVEVKIPAGLADGQTIRLKGQGLPGPGGAGDVLITVAVAPHPVFERDGTNLRIDLPVTLYEAVLGAKVRVPTLDGAVELAIPAGTSGGRTFRLKGKGMPAKDGAGDLYATVRIVLPEGSDRRARGTDAASGATTKPYDPRRDMS